MTNDRSCAGFLLALFLCSGCAVQASASIAQTGAPEAAQMRGEAQRHGSMRVVVTLAVAGANPPSVQAIAAAQERLLAALKGTRYENAIRFQNLPQMALTVQGDALEVLLTSSLVAAVAPDALMGTMAPGTPR